MAYTLPKGLVGKRLKEAREERGLSRGQLSKLSGVSINTLGNNERYFFEPSLYNAVCLAEALEVSLDWLTGRDEFCKDTN